MNKTRGPADVVPCWSQGLDLGMSRAGGSGLRGRLTTAGLYLYNTAVVCSPYPFWLVSAHSVLAFTEIFCISLLLKDSTAFLGPLLYSPARKQSRTHPPPPAPPTLLDLAGRKGMVPDDGFTFLLFFLVNSGAFQSQGGRAKKVERRMIKVLLPSARNSTVALSSLLENRSPQVTISL